MKQKGIPLGKGFKLKDGKPARSERHLDVSKRIAQSKSMRIRVKRGKST